MVLLTMIARIPDGLPLAASMQDDEQVISFYTKKIFKKPNLEKTYVAIYYTRFLYRSEES